MINSTSRQRQINETLYSACRLGYTSIVHDMISSGADVMYRNGVCLQVAINKGYGDIVKILIEHGADINQLDNWGIFWPVIFGNITVLREILNSGIFSSQKNAQALWLACQNKNIEIVNLLLEYGADINIIPNYFIQEYPEFFIPYLRKNWHIYINPDSILYSYSEALKYRIKLPLYIAAINWLYHPDSNFFHKKINSIQNVFY